MKEKLSKDTIQNHKKALRIVNAATKEEWPFFRTFAELKMLHLNRYEVAVPNKLITFFWHDGSETTLKTDERPVGTVGKEFDKQAIENAIAHSKKQVIDHHQFLERICAGGCNCYEVNFTTNEVIYYGINENNKVIEKVDVK